MAENNQTTDNKTLQQETVGGSTVNTTTCIPPISFKRNEFGLLSHINYKFKTDGTVDWRAMIPCEFLVFSKDKKSEIETKYQKPLEQLQTEVQTGQVDPSTIEDKYFLILLGGIKALAKIRGFQSIQHQTEIMSDKGVGVKTTIRWIGNYETDNREVDFTALADATVHNTSNFAKNYLYAIAENRGFVRAVRNFLGINIVGQDEVGSVKEETANNGGNPVEPHQMLEDKLKEKNVDFEKLKNKLLAKAVKDGNTEYEKMVNSWNTISDVPNNEVFHILMLIAEKEKTK